MTGTRKCRRLQWACQSVAERSHPTSEVRGRSREDPRPKGWQPRGVTPRPRSGRAANRRYPVSKVRGGDERRYPVSEVRGGDERSYTMSEVRGGDERSYPESKVRGSGREELPHASKPEAKGGGGEEQPHDQGQGWWPGGPTSCPRSRGRTGAGGPRGAIPH